MREVLESEGGVLKRQDIQEPGGQFVKSRPNAISFPLPLLLQQLTANASVVGFLPT
jgi:hypothetical protein